MFAKLKVKSKDVLKEAIRSFDGTAIIVSHDREFLDGLVSKVYEFGGGKVREHLGGIYDFLRHKNIDSLQQLEISSSKPSDSNVVVTEVISENKKNYAERKEQQKKVKKVEKAVKASEEKIAQMEARIKELDKMLMNPKFATDMKLIEEYSQTMKALDEENDRWMQLSEELEGMM